MRRPPIDEILLRVRLPDRPGSLALLTGRLASYGVDIVRLEVVAREPGSVIDDLVVRGGDAVRALEELQPRVELLATARSPVADDPGLAMAEACTRLETAAHLDELRSELLGGAVRVAHATQGVLLQPLADGRLRPLGATNGDLACIAPGDLPLLDEAVAGGVPVVGRRDGVPALAVPVCDQAALALLLVRGQRLPFLEVEVRRVAALAALGGRLLAASGELAVVR